MVVVASTFADDGPAAVAQTFYDGYMKVVKADGDRHESEGDRAFPDRAHWDPFRSVLTSDTQNRIVSTATRGSPRRTIVW